MVVCFLFDFGFVIALVIISGAFHLFCFNFLIAVHIVVIVLLVAVDCWPSPCPLFLAMFLDLFLCFPLYSRLCNCFPAWQTQYSKQQAEEKTILYWRNKQIIHHKNNKPKQARRRRKKNNISYQFLPCVRFLKFHVRLSSLFLTTCETLRKPFYVLVCWVMCYSYCCWLNVIVCLCLFLLIVVMLKVMVCCSVEFLVFCWHCRTFFQIFFQFCDVLSQTLDTVIPEAFLNLSSQPLPSKEAPCPKDLGTPIAPRPMP